MQRRGGSSMKYKLKNNEVDALMRVVDTSVKSEGLELINEALMIVDAIKNPLEESEDSILYEFSDQHVKVLVSMIDIALKSEGLSNIFVMANLIHILGNGVQENPDTSEELSEE